MTTLNLCAEGTEQLLLKEYLESNASEVLADKINNGVTIEKDGKTLINKKDFSTFMNYACEEARKLAESGARFACIDHSTVFGWAIHYFEENAIEGKLFNEDNTEYIPPKPVIKASTKPITLSPAPAPKPKPQMTMFDLMSGNSAKQAEDVDGELTVADERQEGLPELIQIADNKFCDNDGVIHEAITKTEEPYITSSAEKVLSMLLDGKVRCA